MVVLCRSGYWLTLLRGITNGNATRCIPRHSPPPPSSPHPFLPPPPPTPPPSSSSSPEELRTFLQLKSRGRGFHDCGVRYAWCRCPEKVLDLKCLVLPVAPCPPRQRWNFSENFVRPSFEQPWEQIRNVTLCRRRSSPSTSMGADAVLVLLVQNNVDVHTLFPESS